MAGNEDSELVAGLLPPHGRTTRHSAAEHAPPAGNPPALLVLAFFAAMGVGFLSVSYVNTVLLHHAHHVHGPRGGAKAAMLCAFTRTGCEDAHIAESGKRQLQRAYPVWLH